MPQTLQGDYRQSASMAGARFLISTPRIRRRRMRLPLTSRRPVPRICGVPRHSTRRRCATYLQLPSLDPRIPSWQCRFPLRPAIITTAQPPSKVICARTSATRLQLSRTRPRDPLAEFLFERKQGHCEYFASAMAIMLRTLGIPSRVVNGFRTGEFNDLTSQYVIRDRDAHSWVEAYFPGYGWVSFDPTPVAAAAGHGVWGRMGLYRDAMASFWREWVIEYDVRHQQQLGQEASYAGRSFVRRARHWARRRYERLAGRRSPPAARIGTILGAWAAIPPGPPAAGFTGQLAPPGHECCCSGGWPNIRRTHPGRRPPSGTSACCAAWRDAAGEGRRR